MSVGGLTIDLFKWIIGLLLTVLSIAFGFQQQQLTTLNAKLDGYQNSMQTTIWPALTAINVNLSKMSTDIEWIKRTAVSDDEINK
jgi:hypothetical protein